MTLGQHEIISLQTQVHHRHVRVRKKCNNYCSIKHNNIRSAKNRVTCSRRPFQPVGLVYWFVRVVVTIRILASGHKL